MQTDPYDWADPSASGESTQGEKALSYPDFLARLVEYKRAIYEPLYLPATRTEIKRILTDKPTNSH